MAEAQESREGALAGLRVLDLTDERAIYGAKLLADLGADVVRPEPPEGDPLRDRGPHLANDAHTSLWHAFFASSRRFITLDLESEAGRARLRSLVARADVVLSCADAFAVHDAELDAAVRDRPELIVIDTTSFGRDGAWADYLAPDLVAGALGGAAATTGDVDTPPLKSFGELNFMLSGAYVAIAVLAALHEVREHGAGQRVDVSVHECIASCLEHVFMFQWYADKLNREPVLPRRGALHWSNAYDVLQARGGSIMVTPTPSFDNQLLWLIEENVQEDLIDPKYEEPENQRLRIQRTMDILERWVATKDVESLFFEAQARHAPYGWVLPIEKVAENPQLEARNWFQRYRVGETTVTGAGAPYHFSESAWSVEPQGTVDSSAADVLDAIGWRKEA